MILVNCPLKQEEIIKMVENIEIGNKKQFKFCKKQGITLCFKSDFSDGKLACSTIKQTIKSTDWGKVVYFNVVEVQNM
ncbi:hypothetical protein [Clostridium vincentii]|uniref:Uncharacterized protein n=1 Tax=Clostridium vincentii TaxID=52704 RepID=A0A2T0BGR0_9CLOT|nr:hypothetical protein [Clostridium vincentii]PRR83002.1 hypothetical protein CLVI_12510 [Clostridium vincentii]